MIKLIALRGARGSAQITTEFGQTRIKLNLRSRTSGATALRAYLIAKDRLAQCELTNGEGSAQICGVSGVIITDRNGVILAEGANGLSASALEEAKIKIRSSFEAAAPVSRRDERNPPQKKASPAKRDAKANSTGERSPVTTRILSKAKELFGEDALEVVQSASDGEADSGSKEQARSIEEAPRETQNPFPARFPNSSWLRLPGGKLYGKLTSRGRHYSIEAIPMRSGLPPDAFRGGRRLRGADGVIYIVKISIL